MDVFKWLGIWASVKQAIAELKDTAVVERTVRVSSGEWVNVIEMKIHREKRH